MKKNGLDPDQYASVIGVGLGAHRGRGDGTGPDRCRGDARSLGDGAARPAIRTCASSADTRTQKDTLGVFGGEYPGGALYSARQRGWTGHDKEVQALTNAMLNTLAWIHSHSPEERDGTKMPPEMVGKKQATLSCRIEEHDPNVFGGPARWIRRAPMPCLRCSAKSSPEVAKANIDVTKTYTNKFVEQAKKTTGMNAK